MAVITRYVVVRNGVELERVFEVKKEAEAYDRLLDAADGLSALIKSAPFESRLSDEDIDDISVFLAENGPDVVRILKGVRPMNTASAPRDASDAGRQQPVSVSGKAGGPKRPAKEKKKRP
ncbi:MAG: YebG family protein [Desulfobacterales bacterium]|jgi:dsDNA-binding SOS-regulon protein